MKTLVKGQKYIEYCIFAGVFLILCFFLARYTVYTLDSDASSELVLAKLLSEEGRLLTEDWLYGSELRVFYSQLIFTPLFSVFDSWRAVRFTGTLIMLIALVLAFYWFCRETDNRGSFALTAMLMLLPLSRIYFDVLYKFTYYLPHAVMGFAVPAAVWGYARRKGEGRRGRARLLLALGLLLSFAVGLNGMRLLLTLFAPLLLSALLLLWLNQNAGAERGFLPGCALVSAAAVCGCAVNVLYLSRKYTLLDVTGIDFTAFSFEGLEQVLGGLLQAFGYRSGENVFSLPLLYCALGGLLFVLSLYSSFAILKNRRAYSRGQEFTALFYLTSLAVLCLLYCLTSMVFTLRYVVQAAVLGLLPIVSCFRQKERYGRAGRLIILGLCCFALLCGALHYNEMRKEDKTGTQRQCVDFLVENGYTQGYASFWNGNVVTELSDGALELWVWDEKFAQLQDPDEIVGFLQARSHLQPPGEGKVFVLLSANEDYYCEFARNFKAENVIFKTENYETGALDEYIVYGFESYEEMRSQFYGGEEGES